MVLQTPERHLEGTGSSYLVTVSALPYGQNPMVYGSVLSVEQ